MEVQLHYQGVSHLTRIPSEGGKSALGGVKLLLVKEMLKCAGPTPQVGISSGGAGDEAFHSIYIENLSSGVSKRISINFD